MKKRFFKRVSLRQCPKCGKVYAQREVEQAVMNFSCRCGQARMNDFVIYRVKTGLPTGDLIA